MELKSPSNFNYNIYNMNNALYSQVLNQLINKLMILHKNENRNSKHLYFIYN